MPDLDLRGLERRAAAGELGAGVRLLRERLRGGLLERSRVRMAAFLLDVTALGSLGLVEAGDGIALPLPGGSRVFYVPGETVGDSGLVIANDFREWVNSLESAGVCNGRWGYAARPVPDHLFLLSCSIAAARRGVDSNRWRWKRYASSINYEVEVMLPEIAIEALEAYRDRPCEEHREACMREWHRLRQPTSLSIPHARENPPELIATLRDAARVATPDEVRAAIEKEVPPWLLA